MELNLQPTKDHKKITLSSNKEQDFLFRNNCLYNAAYILPEMNPIQKRKESLQHPSKTEAPNGFAWILNI